MADWKLIRNEYEIMHTSVQELAMSHHIGEVLIENAAKADSWKRRDIDEDNIEEVSSRLTAMEAFHQTSLVPKFINLQAKMLDCCDVLLAGVKDINDAANLKIVSEVIEKHRPNIMGVQKGKEAGVGVMKIVIANKVGDGPNVSISEIQITQSAGETNGLGALETSSPTMKVIN